MPTHSISHGLGEALRTIDVPSRDPKFAECTTNLLQDCQYVGSYNWAPGANKDRPAIIVPGSPNVWIDPQVPLVVRPDQGKRFRDHNNHILPGRPLLPLVAAVERQQILSRDDWKTVDFLTDRNGLRKLLRWIVRASGRDFRIDTQLVGQKTVVLNRWEPTTTEVMPGNTYGFNFEKATTTPMPPFTGRSDGHHRVVTYTFGRFRMVVQFEVDGCLPTGPSTSEGDDELVDAMAGMGLSSQGTSAPRSGNRRGADSVFGLRVQHKGGADIPDSSILEMATTSSPGRVKWDDRYPQLYFSQTSNHFMGHHQGGSFYEIKRRTTSSSPELRKAHTKLQPAFNQLEEALGQIQSMLVQHGKQERLSLVYEKPNLTVYRNLGGSSCLPPEAVALFD